MNAIETYEYEELIGERHTEVFYNGCISCDEDPYDYIDVKEVVSNG